MKTHVLKWPLLALAVMNLMGCDTMYGLTRKVRAHQLDSISCIRRAIDSTHGVKLTAYALRGKEYVDLVGETPRKTHDFWLRTDSANFSLQVEVYKSKWIVIQSRASINSRPPQKEIDEIRPKMLE